MQFVLLYLSVFLSMMVAYLLGSINFALVISRVFYHKDIRDYGSGNAGMTNILRTFGKIPAALTLLGDFLKGIIAIFIADLLITHLGGYPDFMLGLEIVGLFALLGHVYPIYYNFKGGKGVLVSAGIILALDPLTLGILVLVFLLFFGVTRIVSVGSIAAAIAYPIITLIINILQSFSIFTIAMNVFVALLYTAFILYLHRANIKRLLAGEEPKIGKNH